MKSAKISINSFRLKHLQTLCERFERKGLYKCNECSLTTCFLFFGASQSTSGMHCVRKGSESSLLTGGEPQSTFPHKSSEDIPGRISSLVFDGHTIDGPDYYHNAYSVKYQRMEKENRPDV